MLLDPRRGDIEDDAASPGQRSLLAIAGSLLVEISLLKLLFAWTVLLLLPAILPRWAGSHGGHVSGAADSMSECSSATRCSRATRLAARPSSIWPNWRG